MNAIRTNLRTLIGTRVGANYWAKLKPRHRKRTIKPSKWKRNGKLRRTIMAIGSRALAWRRMKRVWANILWPTAWRKQPTIRCWKRVGKSWNRKAESREVFGGRDNRRGAGRPRAFRRRL